VFPQQNYKYPRGKGSRHKGFSVIELLIVVAIIGILFTIAQPSYNSYEEERDYNRARHDIIAIQKSIDRFYVIKNKFPDSLEEINAESLTDPWGTPYYYVNVASYDKHKSDDKVRRDKKLKPVNSDFDLYSAGKDGATKPPFTAKVSRDDIVRCNNGGYLGYAKDY